jgi:hypothetical protein
MRRLRTALAATVAALAAGSATAQDLIEYAPMAGFAGP